MEAEACAEPLKKGENLSQEVLKKLDENCVIGKAKDVTELHPPSALAVDGATSLGPITPDSNRESGDLVFDFTSPLTRVSLPQKALRLDSHQNDDPCSPNEDNSHTPKGGVFDPFAPGPEKLLLAPHTRKHKEELQTSVVRQLNFGSSVKSVRDVSCESDTETPLEEEMLLETVYGSLLGAIVSKQTEGLLAEISPQDTGSDGFKTPTSARAFRGVAETCPGAPVKPRRKLRNIDPGLCRKLEF